MSVSRDGKRVLCDGEGCRAEAWLPVALSPTLSQAAGTGESRIDGWLFADGRAGRRHFCPRCSGHFLGDLAHLSDEQGGRT